MTSVLLATRSTDKAREIREILSAVRAISIMSLEDAGIDEVAEEAGIEAFETFLDNARAKADWFGRRSGLPTLADDSGLCVDALDGAPGVRSRRFAADAGPDRLGQDAANNALLLRRLEGVSAERRGAAYVCAAVLRLTDGRFVEAVGSVRGRIADAPAGDGGFGYDPLFFLSEANATFGEVPPSVKHRYSHRARAFRALAASLDEHLRRSATLG